MALTVTRADVWTATIEDRPGGAAEKLEPLAQAGANFEFLLARRAPEQPGSGLLFLSPVKGARAIKAARAAGFAKSEDIHTLRIEGSDKAGLAADVSRALTEAGINFRGLSAAAIGRKFVAYLALDTADDARNATAILKKLSR